jgi:hypothetical protein
VQQKGGVDGLVYTNTQPLMRSPLSISIPPPRAYMCKADTPGTPAGRGHGVQGSRVEGVHGGWNRRGTTVALWVLRVYGSIRLAKQAVKDIPQGRRGEETEGVAEAGSWGELGRRRGG